MTTAETPPDIFSDLSPEERATLEGFARRREFDKNDVILREGQSNSSLFVVQKGLLHARMRVDQGDTMLSRLEPHSFFGEISVFDPGKTSATVVAVTKGEVLQIDRDRLLLFVAQHPVAGAKLLLRLLQVIAQRVRGADDRLGDALFLNRLMQ